MSPSDGSKKARKSAKIFSEEEQAALLETARERKIASRRSPEEQRIEGERDVLAKIAEMPPADRTIAKKLHAIVTANAPDLMPKTWYGMPAYATKEGKVLCFFQSAAKFESRYASFGFTDEANLDQGAMWPTYFALKKLGPAEEKKIKALVKKAVS